MKIYIITDEKRVQSHFKQALHLLVFEVNYLLPFGKAAF